MLVLATRDEKLTRRFRQQLQDRYTIIEFTDFQSLKRALPRLRPAVAFVDPTLGGRNGMRLLRSLCGECRHTPIVALGSFRDGDLALLHAGVRGAVDRKTPVSLYPRVVAAVVSGEMWFTRRTMSLFLEALGLVDSIGRRSEESAALSERELQVARMAMRGASNRRIGESLAITERTVKAHMTAILAKLRLTHRAELCLLEEGALQLKKRPDASSASETAP